ncbi:lipoprotein [Vibrio harveyi]|nr:lipoprotein [Vibrio harveyi]
MKKLALVAAVGMALSGCGGSGDGGSSTPQPVVKPSAAIGTVESVNDEASTITVNGYTYRVSEVMYGTQKMNLGAVHPNMMVQVGSTVKAASNTTDEPVVVTLEPTMTGTVTAIDHANKTFTVNGVELQFDGLSSEIELNDWVMLSSLPTADAGYKVLSVVKFDFDIDGPDEIEGRISSIDANNSTFKLGANTTVSYNRVDGLEVGQWVEAEGSMQGDVFMATEVEVENYDSLVGDNDVEGIITWVANDYSQFSLNYRGNFVVDNATRFEDGTKTDLKQGQEVEVTSVMKNGVRTATEVEIDGPDFDGGHDSNWKDKEFECEGVVTNYNVNTETFQVSRCENDADQVMSNNTVVIDAQTRFEGLEKHNLNGTKVEVEGVIINNQNVAREVEAESHDD